jgi:nicotinamidase-related amidase
MQAQGGDIVLAGFVGRGGSLATVSDALLAGHRVTLLMDATHDAECKRAFEPSLLALLAAYTKFDLRAMTTGSWIGSTNPLAVDSAASF